MINKNVTIPYAFMISLIVIVFIETFSYSYNNISNRNLLYNRFYGNNNMVPTIDQSIIQWQIFNIRANITEQQDILFFGDSSCLMGIRPHVVMENTNLTAWNIGLLGSLGVEGHAEALSLYLQYNAPPKLAVYHISHFPLEVSDEEVAEMNVLMVLRKWISSHSHKLQSTILFNIIKNSILDSWSDVFDQPRGLYPSDNELRSYLEANRGFLEHPRNHPLLDENIKNPKRDFTTKFDPDNTNNLKTIFDIAQKHNFKLLVVFNPIFELHKTEATIASYTRVKEKVKEAASSYSNVFIEDEPVRFFPDRYCGTVTHLYIEGATKNTQELIPVIQEILYTAE